MVFSPCCWLRIHLLSVQTAGGIATARLQSVSCFGAGQTEVVVGNGQKAASVRQVNIADIIARIVAMAN